MRLLPPFFLLRRLGRTAVRPPAPSRAASDPADMGTEFGLEATLAEMAPLAAASAAACDEPPLAWLGRTAARHPDR